jgi:hypothetical protein
VPDEYGDAATWHVAADERGDRAAARQQRGEACCMPSAHERYPLAQGQPSDRAGAKRRQVNDSLDLHSTESEHPQDRISAGRHCHCHASK